MPNQAALIIGHGHTIDHLDSQKVTRYIALEPNLDMHPMIVKRAEAAGYTRENGRLEIIGTGVEDVVGQFDTIVSILTICSIPDPQSSLKRMVGVLRPGGTFLYYEHVLSTIRSDVAWWQKLWSLPWSWVCDGCRLDRPTHVWVSQLGVWQEQDVWGKEGEDEENLFWHRAGKCVKQN